MSHSKTDIKHIAKLSKLALTEEQITKYGADLDAIVGYMDILNSVPADRLAKISAKNTHILPLREDVITSSDISREVLLSNSKQKKVAGTIAVPNIMHS